METAKNRRYGKVRRGNDLPYGTLAGASQELITAYYYFGYRHDDDLPPLPEVEPDPPEETDPEELMAKADLRRVIDEMLEELGPRNARVIRMRFGIGLGYDYTLEEIGAAYDVTRERIRQIEAKALRHLKHPRRSSALDSFVRYDSLKTSADKAKELEEERKRQEELKQRMAAYETERLATKEMHRKARKEAVVRIPEDTSWVAHLQRTNPELYASLKQHVDKYVNDFFNN